LTMCCKMVLKQIQDKSNLSQPMPETEKAAEITAPEHTEPEFPHITLAESSQDEGTIDDSQHVPQGDGLTETVQESSPQETADLTLASEDESDRLEAAVPDDRQEISFREEPALEKTVENALANELLEKEPVIDLPDPELQIADVGESTSPPGNAEMTHQEEIISPPDLSAGVMSSQEVASEDGKKTCPRCSLKFNPNVKQCPICKVSLLPEAGEQEQAEIPKDPGRDIITPQNEELPSQETLEPSAKHDESNNGKRLEVVACGQPKKTSPTAIRVPLVVKINEIEKEIEVDLAISFGNVVLK